MNRKLAIIFDLDGTILDNKHFHIRAWAKFLNSKGVKITEDEFERKGFGGTNKEYLSFFLKRNISDGDDYILGEEKEQMYRDLYEPFFQPIKGFYNCINNLKSNNIKLAMATMAPKSNVEFTLKRFENPDIFDVIVDYYMIKNGKPDPEIYLKAAELLGLEPDKCIVVEDSFIGIESARRANMKVVGIETYHSANELKDADITIKDYNELTIEKIENLFK